MADNYFGITDTGRVRTNNEDAFIAEKVLQGRFIAACVIDGVGGYEGGEVAARLAQESIKQYLSVPSGDVMTMMREAFVVANEKIAAEKKANAAYESMACVATLALVDMAAKTFYYAHIGDTRLYLLRDNSLVKISKDQSFVGYLEDSGRISEDEAMQHPKRNEINNALGFEATFNATDVIESGSSPFLPGDLLLLCSDGLSDLLKSSEITAVLMNTKTLQAKGRELIRLANERGGKDNITVVLVRNQRKPVLQKATKPNAPIAAVPEPIKIETARSRKTELVEGRKPQKKRNELTMLLGLLCIGLTVALAYLILQRNVPKTTNTSFFQTEKSSAEVALQQALDSTRLAVFSMPDSASNTPLELTDTIHITKDSLVIQGNGMRFLKSSAFAGPAFALSQRCKYIRFENLSLENFDVGIFVQNKALHLENVRFIGCRVPVQSVVFFPDNVPVTGAAGSFFTSDSLFK